MCVYSERVRERMKMSVCVCVCQRERDRERERKVHVANLLATRKLELCPAESLQTDGEIVLL